MEFNINMDATIAHVVKLETISKSALPSAIRGTLNNAAFKLKSKEMPSEADDTFEKRSPNFFKANSKFESAKGFNVNQMKSTVGFFENKLANQATNFAVKDLEKQEEGGSINKRSLIPTIFARKGKSNRGLVRANARLSAIKKIVKSKSMVAKNAKEQFILAASMAGKDGYVSHNGFIYKILSAPMSKLGSKKTTFKAEPIYSVKHGRKAHVRPTNFMRIATERVKMGMPTDFIKEAERQFAKLK